MGTQSHVDDLSQCRDLLTKHGVLCSRGFLAVSLTDALDRASNLKWPLVLKIVSPDIFHKSEVGGVRLGITNYSNLRHSYSDLLKTIHEHAPSARISGVAVEEMVPEGTEVILGMKRDPQFGPVYLFGMGGIYTEILKDVSIGIEPMTLEEIRKMVKGIKGYEILAGARGRKPAAIDQIVDLISKLCQLVADDPLLREIDLNPVIVREHEAIVADAKILYEGREPNEVEYFPLQESSMEALLHPNSMAIVGASSDSSKLGSRLLRNIIEHGFLGRIYPINLRETVVQGKRCYAHIGDVPDPIDLAIVIVPRSSILEVTKECIKKGVRACVMITGGFAETDREGQVLQETMVSIARKGGMRICGPNCEGIIVPSANLCADFGSAIPSSIAQGEIALITQSGGIGSALLCYLGERNIGVSTWISCGNMADLEISDYLAYFSRDPSTSVICLFMEGVKNGQKFVQALDACANAKKFVIASKLGRSKLGAEVARSHTGTLAGSNEVYEAIFKKYGVLRANDVEDLVDLIMAINFQPLPRGFGIGVISGSGGLNGMIADTATEIGLELPKLSDRAIASLEEILGVKASNPIDEYTPKATSVYEEGLVIKKCAEIVAVEPNIDTVILANGGIGGKLAEIYAKAIVEAQSSIRFQVGKPVYTIWTMSGTISHSEVSRILYQNKIPVYPSVSRALKVIRALAESSSSQAKDIRKQNNNKK